MRNYRFSRLESLEDRYPGLCRQLEAMFQALVPVRAISRAIRAQYGESIGWLSLRAYKAECLSLWQTPE